MNQNIIEASQLPSNEKVYLRKDWLGWRVVEPNTKWYHWILGGKKNIFILIVILIVAAILYIGFSEVIDAYKTIADNPCNFCIENSSKFNLTMP